LPGDIIIPQFPYFPYDESVVVLSFATTISMEEAASDNASHLLCEDFAIL
jgi:hypothetical protein